MKPTSESTALEGAEGFVQYSPANKLKGKKAFITGGEYASLAIPHNRSSHSCSVYRVLIFHSSGIGRAVAVLFAREGADISIVYLPEEEDDARETKKLVEKESRQCQLIPGNLMDNDTCKSAIQKHTEKFVLLLTCSS